MNLPASRTHDQGSAEPSPLSGPGARWGTPGGFEALHTRLGNSLRDPLALASLTAASGGTDPRLLEYRSDEAFWKTLRRLDVRLFISREYEHFVMSLAAPGGKPELTTFPIPHPSGIAVERRTGRVHVASTRNPNVLMEFRPAASDSLIPFRARFLPGRLYLHDLAWIDGRLHGTAAGENALLRLSYEDNPSRVWWPRSIEGKGEPLFERNVLQLNSVAAGPTPAASFYTASCESPGGPRPGDLRFRADGRGVILSGRTRQPIARGFTRPHSLRFHGGRLWVNNSGYGELAVVREGGFSRKSQLPGWTRGLAGVGDVLFVGTSKVLSRFSRYAPGLVPDQCICGIHAIEQSTGRELGSIEWPWGNQIFGIEALPVQDSVGFPPDRPPESTRRLFESF